MKFIDNFNIYDIIKIFATAFITSGLTYFLGSRKDKKNKVYEINVDLIDKVYEPIMKIIESSIVPTDGYEGLPKMMVEKIIDIIDQNSNIIDSKLRYFIAGFKEELFIINYDNREMYYSFDNNHKFLDYVDHRCNKLKKKVHRPYDPNAFKTRRFLKDIYYKIHSRVRFVLRRVHTKHKRKNKQK